MNGEEGGESVLSLYVVYLWLACFTVYNILFAFHLLDAVFPKCLGSELAINDGISPRSRYLSGEILVVTLFRNHSYRFTK